MAKITEKFILRFFSLEGTSLKERHQNFAKLLRETKHSLSTNKDEKIDFSRLHPTNHLEKIFKIDAIIYFQDYSEILKILKSENIIFISKVLKSDPLILHEIFGSITGEELVVLFSHFSFNTKLKILNALNLNDTNKGNEFFEVIQENYGLYLASKIITSCSAEFIVQQLKSNKIEVTCGQLLRIIKNHPNFIEEILNALNENHINLFSLFEEKYEKVFAYLMKNRFELFLKLQDKYNTGKFCLGRRSSKSFLTKQNQTIIAQNSKKVYKHLQRNLVYKNLTQENFNIFYMNLFPKSLNEFKETFDDILSITGHSKNLNLLYKMYKSIYGCYLDNEFTTTKLLEIMSPDERETLMENYSRPKEIVEDYWVSFMKTERSLPLLKEKISLTSSIKARANIVPYLVLTCKFNKDIVALGDVCRYMVKKHHNDHWTVKKEFLKTLYTNCNLSKFGEDHWECVIKLIEIGLANNEYFHESVTFRKGYTEFLLRNGLPIVEQLKTWIKVHGDFVNTNTKYYKHCLILSYDLIHLCHEDSELQYYYVRFLAALAEWNNKHPEDKIVLCDYVEAKDSFVAYLKNEQNLVPWEAEDILVQLIEQIVNAKDKIELLQLFYSGKCIYMNGRLLKWLLTNEPSFILNNIEMITKALMKANSRLIWSHLKYYSHLGIPQKMCEILKQCIETKQKYEVTSDKATSAMIALSYLLSAEDYLDFIQTYLPIDYTANVLSDEGKQIYALQKAIAIDLRRIFPASSTIETVLKFCKGDYLNLVQESLYVIAYNIAENKLDHLFEELSTRAVSVRKHPIHLVSKILDKNKTYMLFEKFKDDKNSSLNKHILKGIFCFFSNNPHDKAWGLLKESFKNVDVKDQEILDVLVNYKKVPKAFYKEYVVFAWNFLENISNNSNEAQKQKSCLLDLILTKDVMQVLPKELSEEVIKKYFLQSQEKLHLKINSFAVRYIIYCESEHKERLNFVFENLNDFIKQSWEKYDLSISLNKKIYDFIKEFCINIIEEKILIKSEIFLDFIELFKKIHGEHLFLNEYLYLHFTLIYMTSKTLKETVEGLQKLYNLLSENFGVIITESFREVLPLFLNYFLVSEDNEDELERNRYILIEEMKKNNAVLTVFLLPDETPVFSEFKLKYEAIIKYLLNEQNPVVQIYMSKYLKSLKNNEL